MAKCSVVKSLTGRRAWWYQSGVRVYIYHDTAYVVRVLRSGWPIAATSTWIDLHDLVQSLEQIEPCCEYVMKKPAERRVQGKHSTQLVDQMMTQRYPLLWDHITAVEWEGGEKRDPSSLLIFRDEGVLKGMLRDKDAGLCLWMAAPSFMGLLEAIEGALDDPETEWRVDRVQAGQQASRRKKRE